MTLKYLKNVYCCTYSYINVNQDSIYGHPPGHGIITTSQVSLTSSSFLTDPPTFTLFGDTRGGPPTTYTWTRNGQVISNNASYNISIQVNEDITARLRESHYCSRLTVTVDYLECTSSYSFTNRAMSTMRTSNFSILCNIWLCMYRLALLAAKLL